MVLIVFVYWMILSLIWYFQINFPFKWICIFISLALKNSFELNPWLHRSMINMLTPKTMKDKNPMLDLKYNISLIVLPFQLPEWSTSRTKSVFRKLIIQCHFHKSLVCFLSPTMENIRNDFTKYKYHVLWIKFWAFRDRLPLEQLPPTVTFYIKNLLCNMRCLWYTT